MEEYSEAFVAFDVAKKKHAVAIAEGGRGGEVRMRCGVTPATTTPAVVRSPSASTVSSQSSGDEW